MFVHMSLTVSPPSSTSCKYMSTVATLFPPLRVLTLSKKKSLQGRATSGSSLAGDYARHRLNCLTVNPWLGATAAAVQADACRPTSTSFSTAHVPLQAPAPHSLVPVILLAAAVLEHLQALAVAHGQKRPPGDALLNCCSRATGGGHAKLGQC